MNREQLTNMEVDGLRKLAPTVGVKNAKKYKKAELVEAILRASESAEDSKEASAPEKNGIETIQSDESKKDTADIQENVKAAVPEINMEQKMQYIENAPIGTLVAFRLPNGKVKSAKIINRSNKQQKLKLETSYGKQFIIPYTDVVWVRSTDKWPRGVYNQLKGITEEMNGQ